MPRTTNPTSARMTLSPAEVAMVNELRANAVHYNAGLGDAMAVVTEYLANEISQDVKEVLGYILTKQTTLRRTEA